MPDMLTAGSSFDHYRIDSKIGEGGMGEVYLAEDTKLSRKVALKILPAEVAAREDRLRRFQQEARAASALNHPNILTIHDVGEISGLNFLATEFIDGQTLRDLLNTGPVDIDSLVDISIQITSALAAAHEAGILHRDIKPENVMIRRDHIVKVLDFGLAKLVDDKSSDIDTEGETRAQVQTEPGMIMGTANYMSPEQARGKGTDTRSDIWSLGCVMYEMAAGSVPFAGETTADKLAAIIHKDPLPLTRLRADIPERLDEIISKCLEKDKDERYQSIKDLLVDLRRFKKKHDLDLSLDRSQAPDANKTQLIGAAFSQTGEVAATRASSEFSVAPGRGRKLAFGAAALLVLAAIAAGSAYWYQSGRSPAKPRGEMKMTRLVTGLDGLPGNVAISPDGRFIAYGLLKDGKQGLWVRQVAQQNAVEIVKAVEGAYFLGIQFSPDASLLYFVRGNPENDPSNSIYEMPVLGGREPRKIVSQVTSAPSLSPDARQIAFVRSVESTGESFVTTIGIDGTGERQVARRVGDNWYEGVSWAPDSKRITAAAATTQGGTRYGLVDIELASGKETPFGESNFADRLQRLHWLSDGSGLVVASAINGQPQIWHTAYPSGETTRITNDLNSYGGTMPTADGGTIVASLGEYTTNVWRTAFGEDESKARRLTSGREDGLSGVAQLPDGRIVYTSRTEEGVALMLAAADGGNPQRLALDRYSIQGPAASPDGRYIVFTSFQPDNVPHIWRVDTDGTNLKQLTFAEDYVPSISPDSRTVFFNSYRSGKVAIWRVSIDGGEASQIVESGFSAQLSPDGSQMIYNTTGTYATLNTVLAHPDGNVIRELELPKRASFPVWSRDGKSIIFSLRTGDGGNLWGQPVAGGKAVQLTKFNSLRVEHFSVSADSKSVIAARTSAKNDIVLIKDFR